MGSTTVDESLPNVQRGDIDVATTRVVWITTVYYTRRPLGCSISCNTIQPYSYVWMCTCACVLWGWIEHQEELSANPMAFPAETTASVAGHDREARWASYPHSVSRNVTGISIHPMYQEILISVHIQIYTIHTIQRCNYDHRCTTTYEVHEVSQRKRLSTRFLSVCENSIAIFIRPARPRLFHPNDFDVYRYKSESNRCFIFARKFYRILSEKQRRITYWSIADIVLQEQIAQNI